MSYDCYCDYDMPEFFCQRFPRAAKKYRCYECGGQIIAGERYESVVGKWCGHFDSYRICERCFDIRQWVKNNVPCFCWAYGNLIEDAREAVDEAYWRAPSETVGLRFGLLRRIVKRDRLNRERRAA